jgi:hypothetical protein
MLGGVQDKSAHGGEDKNSHQWVVVVLVFSFGEQLNT